MDVRKILQFTLQDLRLTTFCSCRSSETLVEMCLFKANLQEISIVGLVGKLQLRIFLLYLSLHF
jgi:hypothetical protein